MVDHGVLHVPDNEDGTPEDTLVFELKVKCTRNHSAPKHATDPDDLYVNHKGESPLLISM